jgi:hypothetical protein
MLCYADQTIAITDARGRDGEWYRRPDHSCYMSGESASSISRDMLLGLSYCLLKKKDLASVASINDYALAHSFVMGEGVLSRTLMSGNLIKTYGLLEEHLGGRANTYRSKIPDVWDCSVDGYRAHLLVLHLVLRGKITQGITKKMHTCLSEQYARVPSNPLFSYAYHRYRDGDQKETIAVLLNERYWPNDRLPESSDRCSEWLPMRDPHEWPPCFEDKVFSGGDLVFVTQLLEDDYT